MLTSKLSRRVFLPIIAAAIGLALTLIAANLVSNFTQKNKGLQFSIATGQMQSVLDSRISSYLTLLYGIQGLFAASNSVEANEWAAYNQKLDVPAHFSGVTALAYLERVDAQDASSSPITIHPLHASTDPYYPLVYTSSFSGTTSTSTNIGFDFGSEPTRRAVIMSARDTGLPVATPVVAAISTGDPIFSIYAPLYDHERAAPTTVAARKASFTGVVFAAFRIQQLFESIKADPAFDPAIQFEIFDATSGQAPSKASLVYTSDAASPLVLTPDDSGLSRVTHMDVAGRTWTVLYIARPGFASESLTSYATYGVWAAGILFSFLIAWLLYLFAASRDTAVSLAERLTRDLKKEKDNLLEAKSKDEALLGSIGDAVFAIDTARNIILFNQIAEQLSGYSAEEALGKPYDQVLTFVHEDDGKKNHGFIDIALSGTKTQMANHTEIVHKDGTHTQVSDSAAPVRNGAGEITGAIIVFRDVTHEREVDRAKTEFVSLASHQLRTPLSAISWYAEMLLAGDAGKLTDKQQPFVAQIYESNTRMIDLVSSLLNVSRIDLGTLASSPVELDIVGVADSVLAELAPQISGHEQVIKKEFPKTLSYLADPKLIRILIQNLLTNAVKYTPEKGTITVTLALDTAFRLIVADTGFGIPKDQQDKIFTKLFRADNAKEQVTDGTGLGLYLVKSVVEKHGGKIWFTSEEGKGSTFTIELPKEGMKSLEGSKTLES